MNSYPQGYDHLCIMANLGTKHVEGIQLFICVLCHI
ncbi:hypothetical protein OROGR_025216 [Orobanche gracilis]